MKKLMKIWDYALIALLGLFATGCNINEPPAAEYGPEPEYGPSYSIGTIDISEHASDRLEQ